MSEWPPVRAIAFRHAVHRAEDHPRRLPLHYAAGLRAITYA